MISRFGSGLALSAFALCQALLHVGDLPEGEAMVPFAVVVDSGGEESMLVFPGDSQGEAMESARDHLASTSDTAVMWALAFEVSMRVDGPHKDAIVVEFWSKLDSEVRSVLQRWRRVAGQEHVELIEHVRIIDRDSVREPNSVESVEIRDGIALHTKATHIWRGKLGER